VIKTGGKSEQAAAIGDGPVDAAYKAINEIVKEKNVKLLDYQIKSVTSGKEAQGEPQYA